MTRQEAAHHAGRSARMMAVDDYEIGDSVREPEFDHIVALAARLFQVSAAMVSIVAGATVHFKARTGLDVCELDADIALCAHAVDQHEPMVVEDPLLDERSRTNPLVLGEPHLRFYAGVPLRVASRETIGTLCVVDQSPRSFSDHDRDLLRCLGQFAVDRIEVRRQERQLARLAHHDSLTGLPNRTLLHQRATDILEKRVPLAVLLFDLDGFKRVNDVFGPRPATRSCGPSRKL